MKRLLCLFLLALLPLAGCRQSAAGGSSPFDAVFTEFKSTLEGKNHLQALASLHRMLEDFWAQAPLLMANPRFVKSAGNSYGIYEPKEDDQFTAGEVIYLYMEPVGFTVKANPGGWREFGFTADFKVEDSAGKVLGGQNDFATLPFKSWNYNTEIALTFNYTFNGLASGRYKIVTVVKDMHADKKATVEKWLTVR